MAKTAAKPKAEKKPKVNAEETPEAGDPGVAERIIVSAEGSCGCTLDVQENNIGGVTVTHPGKASSGRHFTQQDLENGLLVGWVTEAHYQDTQ